MARIGGSLKPCPSLFAVYVLNSGLANTVRGSYGRLGFASGKHRADADYISFGEAAATRFHVAGE